MPTCGSIRSTFVPPIKELKYFSHRFECEDLRTYLEHFRAGMDKSKGEASPSYSMLPRRTIRLLRRLIPDLKLIFVMRDPLERAWSHARHSFCQGEANFKGNRVTIDEVTDEDWIVNLDDEWNRLSGDYLGQLQRWLIGLPARAGLYRIFRGPRQLAAEALSPRARVSRSRSRFRRFARRHDRRGQRRLAQDGFAPHPAAPAGTVCRADRRIGRLPRSGVSNPRAGRLGAFVRQRHFSPGRRHARRAPSAISRRPVRRTGAASTGRPTTPRWPVCCPAMTCWRWIFSDSISCGATPGSWRIE